MIMYPAVYVVLTLPIAVGRMVAMTGTKMPDVFFCIVGTMLTSCGWVDALLYTLTRRVLVTNELSTHGQHNYGHTVTAITNNGTRPGDDQNFGLQSMNKEISTARTVTITGGTNRMSRIVERGRSHIREKHSHPDPLRENSPTGSQDSIIKPGPNAIGIVTETSVQVETARHDNSDDSDIIPSPYVSRNQSDSGFSANSEDLR